MPEDAKTRPDVRLGQCTHVGMIRDENQDALGFWEPEDEADFARKGRLVVVCDGMGGAAGGRIASRLAVETIVAAYRDDEGDEVARALWSAIRAANTTVHRESLRDDKQELRGMGTTVTAIVHLGAEVYFGHVGDSRTYLLRGDSIEQMTDDHSLVQHLVDQGKLDPEEAERHEEKNVLLRSLGPRHEVEVDIAVAECRPGDAYLLCSDGLTGLVSDEAIARIVRAGFHFGYDLDKVCRQLVDLANAYGGHDNTTVQILHVVADEGA